MADDGEKAIRIRQSSGKNEVRLMWADKFMARASITGHEEILVGSVLATGEQDENGNPKELSKAEMLANGLNKKAHNELILSCCDKISFGIIKGVKNKVHPKGDAREA